MSEARDAQAVAELMEEDLAYALSLMTPEHRLAVLQELELFVAVEIEGLERGHEF